MWPRSSRSNGPPECGRRSPRHRSGPRRRLRPNSARRPNTLRWSGRRAERSAQPACRLGQLRSPRSEHTPPARIGRPEPKGRSQDRSAGCRSPGRCTRGSPCTDRDGRSRRRCSEGRRSLHCSKNPGTRSGTTRRRWRGPRSDELGQKRPTSFRNTEATAPRTPPWPTP